MLGRVRTSEEDSEERPHGADDAGKLDALVPVHDEEEHREGEEHEHEVLHEAAMETQSNVQMLSATAVQLTESCWDAK